MNTQTTTKTQTENKEGRFLQPGHANLGYRVKWQEGDRAGTQDDLYNSFLSAVAAAEHAQQLALDRSLSYRFSVLDHNNKTVYSC